MGRSGPKWDGPQMGRARNGRASNGRPEMVRPEMAGPEMGYTRFSPKKNRQFSREIQVKFLDKK